MVPNQSELDMTLILTIADRCHSVVCLGWSGGWRAEAQRKTGSRPVWTVLSDPVLTDL